jgi:hypothetical protein
MIDKNISRDEAANALRSVMPDEAFYFYGEIGHHLGATSKSLDEFATIVKGIDPSSVRFHVERGDFENWFRMMGDKSLAGQVAELRGKNISPDELRGKVSSMVRTRVNQLNEIAGSRASEYEEEREKEHEEKEAEKKEEENQEDEEDREEWGKEKKYSIETLEEKEARERVAKINL